MTTRVQFVAGSAATFASIGMIKGTARAAEFTLGIGNTEPTASPANVRGRQIAEQVRKESNGRVEIQIFPNNVLGGQSAMLTQTRSGALAFMLCDGVTLSAVVDVAAIQGVGFAFKSSEQAFAAFDGGLGAYVRKEILAKGIYAHNQMFEIGMRQITSTPRAIKDPGDLAGFKIRTPPGRLSVDLFKSLGAAPTPMNFSEVYTSLQTHVIDGQENPLFLIELAHLYEVQKFLSMTSHQWSGYWLIGNSELWNRIPPDLQTIVTRNFSKYALLQRSDNDLLNSTLLDKLSRSGLTVNKPDPAPFRARLTPLYQSWKTEFGDSVWSLLEKYTGTLH